jgi:hypothetical protein
MVEQGKRARGWHQRYLGARVNCEGVARLPAGAVAWALDDPRHVPYLMVWKEQRSEKLVEAVRVCAFLRLGGLGGVKGRGRKPRTDSHYRASSAAKWRASRPRCPSGWRNQNVRHCP